MAADPPGPAARAKAAMARGDLIAAYDITVHGLAEEPDCEDLRHLQILALARMGDTERAMQLFGEYGLGGSPDPHRRSVGARLLKDRALALPSGEARQSALGDAFAAYHAVYSESGDSFPGINAATLAFLSGRESEAARLAETLLRDPAVAEPTTYYLAVTKAEALLLLRRTDDAAAVLGAGEVRGSDDHGARCSSRRQLGLVADRLELTEAQRAAVLDTVRPPSIVHFAGHMFAQDPLAEARIREEIDRRLDEEDVGFGYGSLAAGADILFAESLIARGGELHIVLPFDERDFIAQSVLPGGEGWLPRFQACLGAASSVTSASGIRFFGDPAQYGFASRVAMGLARLRAEHLDTQAVQVVVWDGAAGAGPAGTGTDVAAWREKGGRSVAIDPGEVDRKLVRPEPAFQSPCERVLVAILFTDFVGFSKLSEEFLPAFWEGVMGCVASVLDERPGDIACRNSWGDALYAVTESASAAAEIALELQSRLARFDYRGLGLDDGTGGMRVGIHYGPAYRTIDHITSCTTFYGTEVSRAARIEPVTPPGAVFVTEPFAAVLALEARDRFTCRYVGRIALAKNYGDFPMYRLQLS